LLLAIAVLIQHSGPLFGIDLVGGPLAVQAFYIISGFYMTLILDGKYARLKRGYSMFIGNRLLRLFPTYLVVLALTIGTYFIVWKTTGVQATVRWGGMVEWSNHGDEMTGATRAGLGMTNLLIFGQDWFMFSHYDAISGSLHHSWKPFTESFPTYRFIVVPQAWSLGLEFTFYFLAPFIVRRRWWVVAALLAASLGLRWFNYHRHLDYDPFTYRFFPHELALFLAGCLGCKLYRARLAQRPISNWLGFSALFTVLTATFLYPLLFPKLNQKAAYLGLFACCIPLIFTWTQNWKWDRWIGDLSYPAYISHVFLLPYVDLAVSRFPFLSQPGLLIGSTLILSVVLHFCVERPIDRIRQERLARSAAAG